MSKPEEQIDEKWVRKVFEKHSMEKSPELELFDTDEIITELATKINKLLIEVYENVLNLPDMQIELPYTKSETSSRHARNKLREERLIPSIKQLQANIREDK